MQWNFPDVAITGNAFSIDTRAVGTATTIPTNIQYVNTGGFTTVGDSGTASFKKTVTPQTDGAGFQSADGAWWQLISIVPTPQMFGAKGDDATNNAVALQRFFDYVISNGTTGFIPKGIYRTNATINVAASPGWSINGAGALTSVLKGSTDNIPILNFGGTAGPALHTYVLTNIGFDYVNIQPVANTSAVPIYFTTMGYEGYFNELRFAKGYCGIKVAPGVGCPWGQNWDNLMWAGQISGCAMDWSGGLNSTPNNKWGRFFVDCAGMSSTSGLAVFHNMKGYNWVIDNVEMLSGTNIGWFNFQAGCEVSIGAIKMEIMNYTGTSTMAGNALINGPNSVVLIDQIAIGGTSCAMNPLNGMSLIGGNIRYAKVDYIYNGCTTVPSNFVIFGGGGNLYRVGRIFNNVTANQVPLTNFLSAGTVENVTYDWLTLPRLTAMGDANYTVTEGGPNIIRANTALTAIRTVEIMPNTNTLFNGQTYKVISKGAVNGANTIIVAAGGTTKATLIADNTCVELVWRRAGSGQAGWEIVYQGPA